MFARRLPLLLLTVVICLLPVGIGAGMSEHGHAVATLDGALANKAAEQAQVLTDYFSRAQSINLLTAHNPAFTHFYALPGSRADKLRQGEPVRREVNLALAYLEQLFPTSIGEACFIDHGGAENARVTQGKWAAPADLAPDESGNPFFKPTFDLPHGVVHQARPYISPDLHEWVISNSTLMPTGDGSKQAIVYFEIRIESFRQAAAALAGQFDIAVIDARSGAVVLDSRNRQGTGDQAPLGRPGDRRFTPIVTASRPTGLHTLGQHPAAYQRLRHLRGNANDWYVVAVNPSVVGPLYGVGPWPIGTVVAALVLLAMAAATFRTSHRALVAAATTDVLTHLGNRRKLMADLTRELAAATEAKPLLLLLFDLNGFKAYNDAFGHPAGDALLARLGATLAAAMRRRGVAYRLGGDEFCVLASVGRDGPEPIVAAAEAALIEHGDGFSITASYGAILLPEEARQAAEAMRLVDQRMYARKASGRRPADRQSKDVLLRALYERHPDLAERFATVATLAEAIGQRIGIPAEERHHLRQAAELHDIGKVAIPDDILQKPGPLTEQEWAFVRGHPLIGERIIGAAPALAPAAKLVRSTHERFDGTGYPDQLAGEAIPIGARIITACDAYTAMLADRPHQPELTVTQALAELDRCAGSQFDPQVVAVLAQVSRELLTSNLADAAARRPHSP